MGGKNPSLTVQVGQQWMKGAPTAENTVMLVEIMLIPLGQRDKFLLLLTLARVCLFSFSIFVAPLSWHPDLCHFSCAIFLVPHSQPEHGTRIFLPLFPQSIGAGEFYRVLGRSRLRV